MAVCNLFNELTDASGNFLMFSQYVEDITHNLVDSDTWKVVPTRFLAFDIDYSKLKSTHEFEESNSNTDIPESEVPDSNTDISELEEPDLNTDIPESEVPDLNTDIPDSEDSGLNTDIPKFFQNYFENGCAYCRTNLKAGDKNIWSPNNFKNLFWNSVIKEKELLTIETDTVTNESYIKELVYNGKIDIHAYNNHKGMGYGEIYCYIPANSKKSYCTITTTENNDTVFNDKTTLEGYDTPIGNYSKVYNVNEIYTINLDDNKVSNDEVDKYKFNTIIVLYSIYSKVNTEWKTVYNNIPLGLYLTGNFPKDSNEISNSVLKHITTEYNSGTSYGLRICTRFSTVGNNSNIITDVISDNSADYENMCSMMSKMNENLSKMLDITKSAINNTQGYKDLIQIIKNNRTNVPYIKTINGDDFWFVNGRMVSTHPIKNTEE